jgi:hypothetical protein
MAETGRMFLYHSDHDINKLGVNTLTSPYCARRSEAAVELPES